MEHVGKLEQMARDAIAKERKRKAAQTAQLAQLTLVAPSPAPSPIRDLLPQTADLREWDRIQNQLRCLTHVYAWIQEDPHLFRRVQLLEHRCQSAATRAASGEFQLAKTQYLAVLGECCECYYLAHGTWHVQELTSMRLSLRRVYLAVNQAALDTHVATLPPEAVCFLAREFPCLIVATQQQILDAVAAKLALPGALLAAV